MKQRILAVAFAAFGIGFAGCQGASAGGRSEPVVIAPHPYKTDHAVTAHSSGACLIDVPVLAAGVAFFELLRDKEYDRHCRGFVEGEHYDDRYDYRRW